jgi:hypothetical protein
MFEYKAKQKIGKEQASCENQFVLNAIALLYMVCNYRQAHSP